MLNNQNRYHNQMCFKVSRPDKDIFAHLKPKMLTWPYDLQKKSFEETFAV